MTAPTARPAAPPTGKPVLLDAYSGAGGAARGYQLAGFYVVGVDIAPQPRYAGDEFHRGDAIEFIRRHGREFDAIHASPPCQKYSTLRVMHNAREHPDLLAPTRVALRASGRPYVIENVPGAPLLSPIRLCGTSFGLGVRVYDGWRELRRHRCFESNVGLLGRPCQHRHATVGIYGDHARDRRRKRGVRDRGIDFPAADKLPLGRAALGMDWAQCWHELSQAIPPAYTEFIGRQLLRALGVPA
jgi:DNA (cytosine-5)-methyltransferase 1